MGLFDKVKNLFTDEEYVDDEEDTVKIREVKKEENKLPTFMRNKIEKEEALERESNSPADFNLVENKEVKIQEIPKAIPKVKINNVDSSINLDEEQKEKESTKCNFRMFDDDDFIETRSRSSRKTVEQEEEIVKEVRLENINNEMFKEQQEKKVNKNNQELKVASLYKDKKEVKKESIKGFRATPIISPIYGVLDKNYQPEDVTENISDNFVGQRPSKNLDFDSVRKKAYGSLAEDIKENLMCENCEYLREAKLCRKKKEKISENEDNLMYNMFDDEKNDDYLEDNIENDITIGDAAENYYDYGKGYEPISTRNNHSSDFKNDDVSEYVNKDVKIVNNNDDIEVNRSRKKEIPPVKSKINLLSTLKKSNGSNDDMDNDSKPENKDLELTDDLFSFIDSMYEERND